MCVYVCVWHVSILGRQSYNIFILLFPFLSSVFFNIEIYLWLTSTSFFCQATIFISIFTIFSLRSNHSFFQKKIHTTFVLSCSVIFIFQTLSNIATMYISYFVYSKTGDFHCFYFNQHFEARNKFKNSFDRKEQKVENNLFSVVVQFHSNHFFNK